MSLMDDILRDRDELIAALRSLTNEVSGVLGLGREALREALGTTNVNVLEHHLNTARAVLQKVTR